MLILADFYGGKAQLITLHGTVSDYQNKQPIEAVSVFSASGRGTVTDSLGKWTLTVPLADSVYFSFLGKNTQKFPVDTLSTPAEFDVALHIDAPWLPEVRVKNRNYLEDSLKNRSDYANIFNFRKPGIGLVESDPSSYVPGSLTAGFDLDELINAFRFKRNRQMLAFQNRLIWDEHDQYVLHRFSKRLVKQITHLEGPELDSFIYNYKPPYDIVLMMNDLELGYYTEQCYKVYLAQKMDKKPKPGEK